MSSYASAQPRPVLSVVLASIESERNLAGALEALREACREVLSEIIVVDASTDESSRIAEASHVPSLVLERDPGTIAPYLWADGIRRSRGRWIALTTGHCVVPPDWARSLISVLEGEVDAVGAGLVPLEECRATDLAVFFLRYHGFLPLTRGEARPAHEVPGDNAAYPGDALRALVASEDVGFFEVEHHATLRRDGRPIFAVPAATAGFGRSFPLGTILMHRFLHGRQFGAHRTRVGGESIASLLCKTPLVPVVLLSRAWRSLRVMPELRPSLIASSIHFLLLASAWALGEATGAVLGTPLDHE